MSEEQARKLIKEEFMNNVMSNLDSALIFTYIQNLEQRIDKLIENWNILKRHFEFLKINTTGGNKEFMEEILEMMNILDGGENNNG